MSELAQQAAAVEAVRRVLVGAKKPSKTEVAYLAERLKEAAKTLRSLEAA